ncbi:hypothetical protein [Mucilaginibacter psychrotolerans]|uniref:Uncharacterized protein n=1 Tax=Mucilaginibacter psychrotolerans TaxID=1524096 RepID=A0A4Y8SNZ2_9SPHI|nr:hypothetical protein [Mucilaginibacter psychrotolerans]TFF40365.1 hypothetical protein E2R66_03710 [Mucilaginibacter psychrotolerans]
MKVIINQDDQPTGVFIPLDEWAQVITSVKRNTALHHLLSRKPARSVFELSPYELNNKLHGVTSQLVAEAYENDLYTSHSSTAGLPNEFIHRYPDGKIELVKIDTTTGREEILKIYQ